MPTVAGLVLTLWLPLLVLWLATSALAALAVQRVHDRDTVPDERLGVEAWLCFAGAGSAGGGLVGTMLLVRDTLLDAGAGLPLGAVARTVAPAMLVGALFTCLLASAVVQAVRR